MGLAFTSQAAFPSFAANSVIDFKTASGATIKAAGNQVLVRYKKDLKTAGQAGLLKTFGVSAKRTLEGINVDVLPVPAGWVRW